MFDVNERVNVVKQQLEKWNIHGCGITVVKDGEVIFAGGAGSRDGQGNPVTENTLFQIASCSKAFTATLAGVLATEGLLDFDTPVINYIPGFRMYDDYATMHLTIRDFLSHRSGMPRHECSWYGSGFTREELMNNLKDLPMNQPIRYTYQYSNYNYLIVGYLIEKVSGMKFEDAMMEKLLKPLGMVNSHVYLDEIESQEDHSLPFNREPEYTMNGNKQIPFYKSPAEADADENGEKVGDPTAPAGCIVSCPKDMAKWIQFNLDKGKADGKQLVREDLMELISTMHSATGKDDDTHTLNCYGLGWSICSYRGHKMMEHGGNLNGFTSSVSFVPSLNMGIFLSCNMDTSLFPKAVYHDFYDAVLGFDDHNWYDEEYSKNDAMFKWVVEFFKSFGGTPIEGTTPSHSLKDYAGEYKAPGYRSMLVSYADGELTLKFNTWTTILKHFHFDSFASTSVICEYPAGLVFTFGNDPKGEVRTLSVTLGGEKNLKPILFTK